MNNHGRVLAGLDNFIEITDGPGPNGQSQRSVHPYRLAGPDEIPAHQIRGGKIVVAGNRYQRPLKPPGKVLHEPGLAATGRPLEQNRQPLVIGSLGDFNFLAGSEIIGFFHNAVFGKGEFFVSHGIMLSVEII